MKLRADERRLVVAALTTLAALLLLHLAGARSATAVISGTAPIGVSTVAGVSYLVAWLGAVLVVPILLLAAAVARALEYAWRRLCLSRPSAPSPSRVD